MNMKKIILIGGTVVLIAIILLLIQRNTSKNQQQEAYLDTFQAVTNEKTFSFPGESTISFGDIKDEPDQVGEYEENAKDKESILVIEYEDKSGQMREVYIKSLDLNNENISYTLRHFTNYFDVLDIAETEYDFKFSIDNFKKEQYKRDVNSGEIVVFNESIHIIMSNDESIDPFMEIFKENNDVEKTFLEFLSENPAAWGQVESTIKDREEKIQEVAEKTPEDLKEFAKVFWQDWINLNTENLKDQYSEIVRFYAGEEWYEEWGMEYDGKKVHEFVDIEQDRLLSAYKNLKSEDFEEDLEGMQELSDSIILYSVDDLLSLCFLEDKEKFTSYFNLMEGDMVMVVRLDSGETCTIDGSFLGGELRLFVIREIEGDYKVVTDFTE